MRDGFPLGLNKEEYCLTIKDSNKGGGSGWVEYIPINNKDKSGSGLLEYCDELIPWSKPPKRLQ